MANPICMHYSAQGVKITERKFWHITDVRACCIRNDLYTRGTNEEYSKMLDMVDDFGPSVKVLYLVAKDICEHSKDQTITNIMYMLEKEAVVTTFEIDGSDQV